MPSEWLRLVKTIDCQKSFAVVYVEYPLTDDLQDNGTLVVQVHDYKLVFHSLLCAPNGIATIRGLEFVRGIAPRCRHSMTGGCDSDIVLLKGGQKVQLPVNALNPLSLKRAY